MKTTTKAAPSCGSCAFCVPIPDDKAEQPYGSCRRSPPIPMMKIDGGVTSAFPTVRLADIWCGEFQKRGK
jgi:hypothetical protein